jgi:hypothetical protein
MLFAFRSLYIYGSTAGALCERSAHVVASEHFWTPLKAACDYFTLPELRAVIVGFEALRNDPARDLPRRPVWRSTYAKSARSMRRATLRIEEHTGLHLRGTSEYEDHWLHLSLAPDENAKSSVFALEVLGNGLPRSEHESRRSSPPVRAHSVGGST